jgi:TPR repeat protein
VDAIIYAARLQRNGARQDAALFQTLVALLEDKDEELRTMANNTLATIRDAEFRGDLGRPENKTPMGGWPQWLEQMSAQAAGYRKDYDVCAAAAGKPANEDAVQAFCKGGAYLMGKDPRTGQATRRDPAQAFQHTLRAAEAGYVPAMNAVALLYANGKGVQQNYAEALPWWEKAAEAGHVQAAFHTSMVYRGGTGVKSDPALSAKWMKYYQEHFPRIP